MSVEYFDPHWQDTESLRLDQLVTYLKECVERSGTKYGSFAVDFQMGPEFEKKYETVKENLQLQGYSCNFKREMTTCPVTGMFAYCCVKKL